MNPAMKNENSQYIQFLKDTLAQRCKKNPQYSLRAFAQSLNVNHTTLSRIMNGQRRLTEKMQKTFSESLNLSPEEQRKYSGAVANIDDQKNFRDLSQDVFELIANWQHDCILELPRIYGFKPTPKNIAQALKINIHEVNAAIERLQRLELLTIDDKGQWYLSPDTTNITNTPSTNSAARKYQKEVLAQAIQAIDDVAIERRDHTGVTIAIDTKDIPELKKMIKKFRRELSEFAQRKKIRADQVYQLNVALFPLTNIKKGEEK